jgi:transcriptional regulator with XRE-family HTH domain
MDGQRLIRLRQQAGLTQEGLAAKSGLHQTAISLLERSEVASPKLSTMRALARGFDMDLADFIAEVDPQIEQAGERAS